MFIKTIKVKKPGRLAAVLAAAGILLAVLLVCAAVKYSGRSVYELNSETRRQEFLKEMGWETSDEYDECKAVKIPEKWNDVYINYNKLQKEQGFDLTDYKGKNVEVYTYRVKNYPGRENSEGVVCNLMIYKGQLIGGDVCSAELDGFMQGLKK